MALGISPYTPHSTYLRGTINPTVIIRFSSGLGLGVGVGRCIPIRIPVYSPMMEPIVTLE